MNPPKPDRTRFPLVYVAAAVEADTLQRAPDAFVSLHGAVCAGIM